MGDTGGRSGGQIDHEAFAITTQATVRSQSRLHDRSVAVMSKECSIERMNMNERGFSSSVGAESPLHVEKLIEHTEQLGCPDLRSKKSIWQNSSMSRRADNVKGTHRSLSVPSNVKPRQQLRLPSFKSLGIATPYPDALLTPPDEASLIHWKPPTLGMSDPPTSQPSRELVGMDSRVAMPEAPTFSGSVPEGNTSAPSSAAAPPLITVHKDEKGDGGSTSSSDEAPETPSWIERATQVVGRLRLHAQSYDASLTSNSIRCCILQRNKQCIKCAVPHTTVSPIRGCEGCANGVHSYHYCAAEQH